MSGTPGSQNKDRSPSPLLSQHSRRISSRGNSAMSPLVAAAGFDRRAASPGHRMNNPHRIDHRVRKNSNGGILVTKDEIKCAFELLDVDASGVISMHNLKKRLGLLFPEMNSKDYRFLMDNKKELMIEDLNDLLLDNEVTNFDPIAEAYRIFSTDPAPFNSANSNNQSNLVDSTGGLSAQKLRDFFQGFGMGILTDEELAVLARTVDLDGDGIVSLEDFHNMFESREGGNADLSTH